MKGFGAATRLGTATETDLFRQEIELEKARRNIDEILAGPEAGQRTFCFYKGKPTSMSLAEQVHRFAASYLR